MTTPSPRLDGGHTPGPWVIEDGWLQNERGPFVDGQYLSVCMSATRLADAHLIAAAPDGLEFAEWIAYHWENQDMNHETFRVEAFRRAEKFITRARGKDHA